MLLEWKRQPQQPVLVRGGDALRVDLALELDAALEGAVVDLHGEITRTRARRTLAPARDDERAPRRHDLDRRRVDAGQLDDDVHGRRFVRPIAVAGRAEPAAEAGVARHLPEIREELLDLALELVEVAPAAGHGFRPTPRSS